MSLFSSIRMAGNTLRADQIAMQVIGQNIANANTPGYIREEVHLTPAAPQQYGRLTLGLGVEVSAVVQKLDRFLEERLRGAVSDRASAATREEIFIELERLIGELSETDLSTSLNSFFDSISEILNEPENVAARNLAVLNGEALAGDINRLADRVLARRYQPSCPTAVLAGTGDFSALPRWERTLQRLFFACFFARSVELEWIDLNNLHVAGDGSKLPT